MQSRAHAANPTHGPYACSRSQDRRRCVWKWSGAVHTWLGALEPPCSRWRSSTTGPLTGAQNQVLATVAVHRAAHTANGQFECRLLKRGLHLPPPKVA